jgi:hypothetical protein
MNAPELTALDWLRLFAPESMARRAGQTERAHGSREALKFHGGERQMTESALCPLCQGQGWICEDHPHYPMAHGRCPSAGAACPICNKTEAAFFPTGVPAQPKEGERN